jgi:hypothetical protein
MEADMMLEEFKTWYDFGIHLPLKDRRESEGRSAEPNRPPLADGEGYDVDVLSAFLDG